MAQRYAFDHGVFFVNLAALTAPQAIVPTVAQAIGFSFYAGQEHSQQLLDFVRKRSMLLILDNFEHLLAPRCVPPVRGEEKGGAQLVVDLLKTAPDVTILATSRARLNLQGEQLFHVAGMEVPDEESTEHVSEYSAVALFCSSAGQIQPSFEFTARIAADIVRICRLVDGMPLAILLAAGWVQVLTPEQIVSEIQQSLDFLRTDLSDVPERHRSMRAVFDHSWRLLTERERHVFRGLCVFRGGFTREAAQKVTGATLRELMALTNKSLLQRASSGRYDMHSLLQDYAAEKLQSSGKADAARDIHSAYYATFMWDRNTDLKGRRQLGALDEIEADFENVRAAWDWGIERKRYATATIGRMMSSLGLFCMYRSRGEEHQAFIQGARERLAPGTDEEPHPVWTLALLIQEYYARPHEADPAQIESCLTIAQELGDRTMVGACLRILGEIALNAADYSGALSYFEGSLVLCRDLEDDFYTAMTLYYLAQTYRLLGHPEQAITLARQSLELSRDIGDQYWAASALGNTGVIAFYTGNYSEAEGYLQEANAIYRELGNKEGIAASNVILRALAGLRDDEKRFNALSEEALDIAADIGVRRIRQSMGYLPEWLAMEFERGWRAPADEPAPAAETDVPLPQTIDRYQVKRLLGVGGVSAVYLAYDPGSGHEVAIKVISREALEASDALRMMWKAAAETTPKLIHPAIPRVYDNGETADLAYIVVELIKGKDLDTVLAEQKGFLPQRDVIGWALQICDVLIYVHNQQPAPLVYSDVKPGNIMLDQDGQVRLVEWGLVKAYQPGRVQAPIGTPGYAPLEQHFGYTDARSDIYALGVTLHHLLTRRDPRLAYKTKDDPFVFRDVPPRAFNPAISEKLEAAVLKAVEKHPEDRFQTVEEMKEALLACLE
jgi:predicted ATPase